MRGTLSDLVSGRVVSFGCRRRPNRDDNPRDARGPRLMQVNALASVPTAGKANRSAGSVRHETGIPPRIPGVTADGLGQRVNFGRRRSWRDAARDPTAQRPVESNPHPPVCQSNGALADRVPRQRNRVNDADSEVEPAVSLDRLSIFRAVFLSREVRDRASPMGSGGLPRPGEKTRRSSRSSGGPPIRAAAVVWIAKVRSVAA